MRVTEKGQVTIPKPIRDRLGIGPGTEVDFVFQNGAVQLVRVEETKSGELEGRGDQAVRALREAGRKYARKGLTSDEIMEMTRGPFDDVNSD